MSVTHADHFYGFLCLYAFAEESRSTQDLSSILACKYCRGQSPLARPCGCPATIAQRNHQQPLPSDTFGSNTTVERVRYKQTSRSTRFRRVKFADPDEEAHLCARDPRSRTAVSGRPQWPTILSCNQRKAVYESSYSRRRFQPLYCAFIITRTDGSWYTA